jgi:hypothetical protein
MIQSQSSELSESLMGGDDNASQSSQRSGISLLQRIQMQRNREALQQHQETRPQQIQVPQYNHIPANENFDGGGIEQPGSNFLSTAWNNISTSMETGMASLQPEGDGMEANDALLAPSARRGEGEREYSMVTYFLTFIRDMNALFYSLPVWARLVVVVVLFYIAIKLL